MGIYSPVALIRYVWVSLSAMRMIDLTLAISAALPTFPGSPGPQFIQWSGLEEDGYNLELLFTSTHAGTHLDAPYHFAKDGLRVDQIPLDRLVGRAVLVKLDGAAEPNHAITAEEIASFERSNRGCVIPENTPVFFHTGWQRRRLKKDDYFTANPGLDGSAAEYLVSRGAGLVGIDSPSIDVGSDASFTVHRILAGADVLIVENLANLDRVRANKLDFAIFPLKLKGASGSPVRAVAL